MPRLTPAQMFFRCNKIGGSDISAVAGLNPWRGAIAVWLEKMGLAEQAAETEAQEMGHELEDVICRRAGRKTGLVLLPGESEIHPDHPWAFATPDRVCHEKAIIVEAKNVGSRVAHHWSDDAPPVYVMAQVQWQLGCCRLPDGSRYQSATVAALIGGRENRYYEGILPDEDVWTALLAVGEQFYRDHILGNEPPPVDGTDAAKEYLDRLYPRNIKDVIEAPPDALDWARRLRDAKRVIDEATEQKAEAENRLRQMIGEADGIFGPFGRLTWKAPKDRAVTDWQALAIAKGATPEEIAAHTTAVPQSRRFITTGLKEEF